MSNPNIHTQHQHIKLLSVFQTGLDLLFFRRPCYVYTITKPNLHPIHIPTAQQPLLRRRLRHIPANGSVLPLASKQRLDLAEHDIRVGDARRVVVHGEDADADAAVGNDVRLAGQAAVAVVAGVDAGSEGAHIAPSKCTIRLVEDGDVGLGGAGEARLDDGGQLARRELGDVDVDAVAEGQDAGAVGGCTQNLVEDKVRGFCGEGGRVRRVGDVAVVDGFVARAEGDGRDRARHGGPRGACRAAQVHDEGPQVGAVVGACDGDVGPPAGVVAWEHVVEGDEGTGGGGAVVVLGWGSVRRMRGKDVLSVQGMLTQMLLSLGSVPTAGAPAGTMSYCAGDVRFL